MHLLVPRSSFLLGVVAFQLLSQIGHAAPPPARGNTTSAAVSEAPAGKRAEPERATSIPEPGSPTLLFLLAAGGLAIGRRLSRSGRRRSPDG